MLGIKKARRLKIQGVPVTLVRSGLLENADPLVTMYKDGEIRMREDVFAKYGKESKDGISKASMLGALLHESYHKKSYLARPSVWRWMNLIRYLLLVSWLVVAAALFVLAVTSLAAQNTGMFELALLALLSSAVLVLLGLKLYLSVSREQESAADAYEAYRVGSSKAKASLDGFVRAGYIGKSQRYLATHGTLAERKKSIDSLFKNK